MNFGESYVDLMWQMLCRTISTFVFREKKLGRRVKCGEGNF